MKALFIVSLAVVFASSTGNCQASPTIEGVGAFNHYISQVEADLEQRHHTAQSFLHFNDSDSRSKLRQGQILIEPVPAPDVSDALIHHWVGSLFIPNARLSDFLNVAQDYPNLSRYYAPQVLNSRLLENSPNHFTAEMRVRQHHVVTVVMEIVNNIDYRTLDPHHGFSSSRSVQIREVKSPGSTEERLLGPGEDHGFLWRLNSYWTYVEDSDGLTLECEAISLTRDIPRGLGWLVRPFIQSVPRESLQFTLEATRKALMERNLAHVN